MPREADPSVASDVNDQPSLFDMFREPLRASETPLAAYTDLELALLIVEWQKKYKK